ncbi:MULTISPECIES: V-type ATP synthase subunit G [Methanosarcina]|jgi:hypothetical protein|uniref:A-type ATP synthase subunit G n=2 Tax=Methanosarcina mazei TaxID=2209 RepID=ATPG_METMA|nr:MULTISPECIES: V-type ATP synthase subunit G [Methanosarcina]Q60189.1 RecName: Full=V-type ATP synthase subunit G; AltName: Full=V-type ATPase subunit G [Methanosarcina mazei Go1]AAC06378.1 A1AO H+ ATPase, subunit G [Methanosarcina mazei Go1]KKF98305.1 ATP synthase subunit G [Methanosarcina mazei]KKF98330.1 ATP synthase subunit G [Methanosarcina mazei]KKG02093.1 ATP synthase subunit G [Methanosarcina mazei]KKG18954.1 ATP synthase subunit G [Methanosarcina mazei]
MAECDDRPNLVERAVMKLGEPKNQARLLQVAWRISLLMMVIGFIIIIKTISPNFM